MTMNDGVAAVPPEARQLESASRPAWWTTAWRSVSFQLQQHPGAVIATAEFVQSMLACSINRPAVAATFPRLRGFAVHRRQYQRERGLLRRACWLSSPSWAGFLLRVIFVHEAAHQAALHRRRRAHGNE